MTGGRFTVVPLGGRFGALVRGPAPAGPLHATEIGTLRKALLAHKVLGMRGWHLGPEDHRRLVAAFGHLDPEPRDAGRPAAPVPPAARWVTEESHRVAPPGIVSVRAVSPDVAGECTLFADVTAAYRDLPAPLRALADRSWAVHADADEPGHGLDHLVPDGLLQAAVHPLTRLHIETGDRGLLLGGHVRQVLGLTPGESRTVVHLLQSYLVRPRNQLRWDWQPGDLLLVDARAVQVRVRAGTRPGPATTARLAVSGDPPLGVDGRHSRALAAGVQLGLRTA